MCPVLAACPIPYGSTTGPLDPHHFLKPSPSPTPLHVHLNPSDGKLDLCGRRQNSHWLRAIRLADDCHAYNIELGTFVCGTKSRYVLKTVRTIDLGEEFRLWFSADVLTCLQIPFLSPIHIQGQRRYVCERCTTVFESPNPLKLHLATVCGQFAVEQLWGRLFPTPHHQKTCVYFDFKLSPAIETFVSSLGGKSKQGGHLCLYCGKCYSRKYGLKIHIRTHTGYKPLKCRFCLRPFGDPSNLNKHIRLHSGGTNPYKCDLCGKILVRRRDLERHLKSRHLLVLHPRH